MSKRAASKPGPKPPAKTPDKDAKIEPELPRPRPLQQHRKLFVILLIAFAIWLGGLLTLYFTKVYPMRYPGNTPVPSETATRPGASGLPSAPR